MEDRREAFENDFANFDESDEEGPVQNDLTHMTQKLNVQ